MSGPLDATITLVFPSNPTAIFPIGSIEQDAAFNVLAHVEVGGFLLDLGAQHALRVTLQNASKSTTLAQGALAEAPVPASALPHGPFNGVLTVSVPPGWAPTAAEAESGDALKILAVYTVILGKTKNRTTIESQHFIVT